MKCLKNVIILEQLQYKYCTTIAKTKDRVIEKKEQINGIISVRERIIKIEVGKKCLT